MKKLPIFAMVVMIGLLLTSQMVMSGCTGDPSEPPTPDEIKKLPPPPPIMPFPPLGPWPEDYNPYPNRQK